METVIKHIGKLLFHHNCVIVPGLGGFVANYQSAKMHPVSYIFNSPSKSLAFNINLQHNDGLLLYQLVAEEHITATEAEKQIREFVADVQLTLSKNQTYKLQHIGRLMNDIEGNLQFIPDATENYLQEAYGLYNFTAQPVIRKEAVIKHLEPGYMKPAAEKKRKVKLWIPAAAILLIVLAVLSIFFQSNNNTYNFAELTGPEGLFGKKEYVSKKLHLKKIEQNRTYFRQMKRTQEVSQSEETIPGSENIQEEISEPNVKNLPNLTLNGQVSSAYSIIAGVYGKKEYAENIAAQLIAKNYTPQVILKNNNYMISLPVPADANLVKYRLDFANATGINDAWVMKNK